MISCFVCSINSLPFGIPTDDIQQVAQESIDSSIHISAILDVLHPPGSMARCAVGAEVRVSWLRFEDELGYTAATMKDERMGGVRLDDTTEG
jgi:hypothetical protein